MRSGTPQRGLATLDADLSQAVVRISRLRGGTSAPAFSGAKPGSSPSRSCSSYAAAGAIPVTSATRPSSAWNIGGATRKFERVSYPLVDGAEPSEPSTLFDHVTDVKVRYRAPKGDWLDVWGTDPNKLPVAVELIVTRAGEPPLTLNFLVGPAGGSTRGPAVAQRGRRRGGVGQCLLTPLRTNERGAALLTVPLLVAILAVIAAVALDRLVLASRMTRNLVSADQGAPI